MQGACMGEELPPLSVLRPEWTPKNGRQTSPQKVSSPSTDSEVTPYPVSLSVPPWVSLGRPGAPHL